jgi:hypothetical protein
MRLFSRFTFFAHLCASFTLHAAPTVVPCLRIAGPPPIIDGNINDSIWKEAKWQDGFTELGTGKLAEQGTRFAIAHDNGCLYVAIRCTEPKLDKIKAVVTRRDDSQLYNDDVVDFFVAPGPQRTDYYQFQINSKGVVADAAGRQSGTVREASWNSALQVATTAGNGEWTVEMVRPFRAIGGSMWRASDGQVKRSNSRLLCR